MALNNPLRDKGFLQQLNRYRIKQYSAAILLLDFETERPIARLEGRVIDGSITISGESPTRRVGALKILFDPSTAKITNLDNLISLNKKISLSIGVENPFYQIGKYSEYGDTIWFKQGVFLITSASSSISTSGYSLDIQLIDKMGLLNGVCGGTLPATASLHDKIILDAEENMTTLYPRINQIIKEVVHHFGQEHYSRIIVSDVPDKGRQVIAWNSKVPIYFSENSTSFVMGNQVNTNDFPIQKTAGEDLGYLSTDLTYPGELVVQSGATVTSILDTIIETLGGNFEYFYDTEGVFFFQRIKNFDRTGEAPILNGAQITSPFNINPSFQENLLFQKKYFPLFYEEAFIDEFSSLDYVSQVSFIPQYSNIKNDFTVWGTRPAAEGVERAVRYHLTIDEKPKDTGDKALCRKVIYIIKNLESQEVLKYSLSSGVPSSDYIAEVFAPSLVTALPQGAPKFDWREELFRRALLSWGTSTSGSIYDEELLAEWRLIYNPLKLQRDIEGKIINNPYAADFAERWEAIYEDEVPWTGYSPDVAAAPHKIRYWLDIIDVNTGIGEYAIKKIGLRSVVVENSNIGEVLNRNVPDIVFVDGSQPEEDKLKEVSDLVSIGQKYLFIQPPLTSYIKPRNSFGSCYEEIRDLLYNHLFYGASLSLTTALAPYLDVNQAVTVNYPEIDVRGNYLITNISFNLGLSSSMNLQLKEIPTII